MTIEELRDLIEIALRSASAVERRWIEALVARLNAENKAEPEAPDHPAP